MQKSLVLIACALTLFAASSAVAGETVRVRFFVFTAPPTSDWVEADGKSDTQRRAESVSHLQKELDGRKGIALADTVDAADVLVEVLKSAREATDVLQTQIWGFGAGTIQPATKRMVRVRLSVAKAQYVTQFEPKTYYANWRWQARDVAGQIERWAKANRARITAVSHP